MIIKNSPRITRNDVSLIIGGDVAIIVVDCDVGII
jgi:hypothetical protein